MDEGGLFGSLMGSPWSRLLPSGADEAGKAPPPVGRSPQRSPCDVLRLPARDMHDFGHWPETDSFCTVECELCGRLVVPHALRRHMEESHVDALATLTAKMTKSSKKMSPMSPPQQLQVLSQSQSQPQPPAPTPQPAEEDIETDPATVYCSLCSASVVATAFRRHAIKTHGDINSAKPLKTKTVVKPSPPKKSTSKSASGSPIDLTDDQSKESKKLSRKKPKDEKKSKRKKEKACGIGDYDPCNHCGVVNDDGNPCLRNIVCRLHPVALRRLVQRPFPYDVLAKCTKFVDEERRQKTEPVPEMPEMPETVPDPPPVKRIKTEIIAEYEETVEESVVPRPKPILCWGIDRPASPPIPTPPPFLLTDVSWHTSHPRPLATNMFGCRIVGGLLTPSKKWDSFRKHIQSVWATQDATASKTTKPIAAKKPQTVRRKRKSSSGNGDNLLNGLLQPTNGVNGVPLRLINGNQSTFIQLNLCPSK